MRLRPSVGETARSAGESSPDPSSRGSGGPARTLFFVAVASAAVAYVVSRLRSSGEREAGLEAPLETARNRTAAAVPDEVGDRVSETVPDEVGDRVSEAVPAESQPIPIGDRDSDEGESENEADTGSESEDSGADADSEPADAAPDVGDVGEPIDEEDVNADLADEPSSTKISSGSSDEIQDKPAEPGEMAVEDDVEELADESDVDEE